MSGSCLCVPCPDTGIKSSGLVHCAECCFGTRVESYDARCTVPGHAEQAAAQFGTEGDCEHCLRAARVSETVRDGVHPLVAAVEALVTWLMTQRFAQPALNKKEQQ